VFQPLLAQLRAEGICYQGIIYAGTMVSGDTPAVLEFNCRFGDPETQAVLPLLESDLVDLCQAVAEGGLTTGHVAWSATHAACIVLASKGYPEGPVVGEPIEGLSEAGRVPGVTVFHAGTQRTKERLETAAGRVLGVTARAASLTSALGRTYEAVDRIDFAGMQYRRDIAAGASFSPVRSESR
jgi:phosphoribosylamine---glycine ligase